MTRSLFIATSVPLPMAMLTSALTGFGASLMPLPAMATTQALGLWPRYRGQLVCRLDYFGVRAKTVTATSMAR